MSSVSAKVFVAITVSSAVLLLAAPSQARPNPRTAAELGYLSGRYYRAISYAGRMPQNDAYTIELLARVDGRRRLRDLFTEIARESQLEEDSVARAGLPAVRRLLELGFLARAS